MKRKLLLLAALLTAGCAQEDGLLVPGNRATIVGGADLAADTDSDQFHCEYIEDTERGVVVRVCWRDETGGNGDGGGVCWYLVTYYCMSGVCVKISEELLWCDGDGGDGENTCTSAQSDLEEEYEDEGLTGWPCSKFSTAHSHLILQDGDTEHGKHDGYGFVHADLAGGYSSTKSNYGKSMNITSGYRCPAGDRAAGGSGRGWHVFGRAVDIVPATVNDAEWQALLDAVIRAGAIGIIDNSSYPSKPHIHARWGG